MSSNASVTSSKRELETADLIQEIDAIRTMNSSLCLYLENLKTFRKNLTAINSNCKQLKKVNMQWVDILSAMK